MWNRKALCSNGVPCRSRMRKRISPSSASSSSSRRRAKLTRAALTTERSSAIAASSRTKPWSRTAIALSGITSAVTATGTRLARTPDVAGTLYVGTSGWSYPSWRPDFYPAGLRERGVPRLLCRPLPVGGAEHDRVPVAVGGAVRALGRADAGTASASRSSAAAGDTVARRRSRSASGGSASGSGRCESWSRARATTACSRCCSARRSCSSRSTAATRAGRRRCRPGGARRTTGRPTAPFRYLRFREPPYAEEQLGGARGADRAAARGGIEVFAYFRHEDAPIGPESAARLLELVRADGRSSAHGLDARTNVNCG